MISRFWLWVSQHPRYAYLYDSCRQHPQFNPHAHRLYHVLDNIALITTGDVGEREQLRHRVKIAHRAWRKR